ncbi:uncharacterized protein LOC113061840 isoform X2 [Tachysurus ichikawai]
MMKGCLQADGHRVQWNRIKESMHKMDAPRILERMTQLGCIVRRSYFVQNPLSLVHIDTNHKLIRYNIIIFSGIDGFSRKRDLHTFSEGWDNHPLRSENGLTPNQMWIMGHMHNSSGGDEDNFQNLELFGTDWETFDSVTEDDVGVHVPEIECPLKYSL